MLQSKDTFSQINKIYSVLIPGRPTGNPGSEIVPQYSSSKIPGGGRRTSHMKGVGMLVGNFELNP